MISYWVQKSQLAYTHKQVTCALICFHGFLTQWTLFWAPLMKYNWSLTQGVLGQINYMVTCCNGCVEVYQNYVHAFQWNYISSQDIPLIVVNVSEVRAIHRANWHRVWSRPWNYIVRQYCQFTEINPVGILVMPHHTRNVHIHLSVGNWLDAL